MYKRHFGLHCEPFAMTPDPSFLFLTAAHREALAGLTYAILSRKGFVVLTGEAGTGKTTLLTQMLQSMPATKPTAVIFNPTLSAEEFLELALTDFGLTDFSASKAQRLIRLRQFLMDTNATGKAAVLVIDEAHRLSPDLLEEIRLLSNFELPQGKLLQIVLAGQNEMTEVLNRNELRQLKQRIAVRLHIGPLAGADVEQYIRHRWTKAGATQPIPFSAEVVEHIARYSGGIPRLINTICDNTLLLAYGEGTSKVTMRNLNEAVRDLELATVVPKPQAAAASNGEVGDGKVAVMPTLERYSPPMPKPSLLTRWMRRKYQAVEPI